MVFTDADMTIGVTRGDSCEIVVRAKNKPVDSFVTVAEAVEELNCIIDL